MNNLPIQTYESVVQQRDALAAENVALKSLSIKLFNLGYLTGHDSTVEGCFIDVHRNDIYTYHDDVVAEIVEDEVETPATDAFTRELMAKGVDMAISHIHKKFEGTGQIGVPVMALEWLAKNIRAGGNDAQ